jgi:hypothetical protein
MEELMQRVRGVLARAFDGAIINLDPASPAEKVGGIVIWDGFEGMEQIERQRLLASKIREGLSPAEQLKVTAILTLTNAETSMPMES